MSQTTPCRPDGAAAATGKLVCRLSAAGRTSARFDHLHRHGGGQSGVGLFAHRRRPLSGYAAQLGESWHWLSALGFGAYARSRSGCGLAALWIWSGVRLGRRCVARRRTYSIARQAHFAGQAPVRLCRARPKGVGGVRPTGKITTGFATAGWPRPRRRCWTSIQRHKHGWIALSKISRSSCPFPRRWL